MNIFLRNVNSASFVSSRSLQRSRLCLRPRYLSKVVIQNPHDAQESCFLTENAAERLAGIKQKTGKSDVVLRLQVQGGGCKGFEYVFETTDAAPEAEDFVFETNGERLVIDDVSFDLVKGSKIDFTEDLIRASFEVVDNPNADGSCGCGTSFAAKMEF